MIYVCVDIGPALDEISSVHFNVHRGEVQTTSKTTFYNNQPRNSFFKEPYLLNFLIIL